MDVLDKIQELQAIPADQHLFCPRNDTDTSSVYFDEDVANQEPNEDAAAATKRKLKIQEAQERKLLALDALQILAFEGEEAAPYREWMTERMNTLMTSCDVCVRVFHQSRAEWKTRLVEHYDEENTINFLREIDDLCLKRIQHGLDEAESVLRAAEPNKRGVRILPNEATYAFFEALSCDALIRNEELIQRHFDSPFQLVQSRKRLKLQSFLPAMTRFLFSRNEQRQQWAYMSWNSSKRNILMLEFDWAVRDHLIDAMMKVQMTNLDLPFVATFWSGTKLIITRLDKYLITHSIRGLDGDFYRLLLDHLSLRSEGFLDLIATMTLLLEKAPTDFWDAMNAITPSTATVVEQVFNSPVLKQILHAATEHNPNVMENLYEAFSWITPFLSSIKATNLTPVVRTFANQLFGRLQFDSYTRASRAHCFKQGLRVLDYAFQKMSEGKTTSSFVGQPTVNGMLNMLSIHIEILVTSLKQFEKSQNHEDLRLSLSMIQHAFILECQSLFAERALISAKQPSPTEIPPSSPIWKTILKAIDSENIELATHLLIAGRNLIGLEPLVWKTNDKTPPAVRHFNDRFQVLSQSITDVIDRLAEFDVRQLDVLFEQPSAASAIVSSLFSSTEETRNSTIELLKVISSQDERRDALQHILRTYYRNVLQGVSDSCRQVTRKKTFAPAPSMIRTLSDIIDVMCNSQDGILRSRSLNSKEAGVTMNFWKNLWDALSMIFKTTEDWSNLGSSDKQSMMDFCRDTMQFADQLFDQCSMFSTVLTASMTESEDTTGLLKELLELPAKTMNGMAKWLRLRDEFLSSKSVTLIGKLLVRLHGVSIEVDPETLTYMERVLSGEIRAKLSPQQQAELQRALETHLGHSIAKAAESVKQPRQGSLSKWMSTGSAVSDGKIKDNKETDPRAKLMASFSRNSSAFGTLQAQREAKRTQEAKNSKQLDDKKNAEQAEFKKKRQAEKEAQLKARAAAVAKAKQSRVSSHTAEAGSGLDGLGVLGKDQAPKGEGLMHSSDDSDDEGDFDEDLFGIKKVKGQNGPKTNIVNEIKVQQPVKKRRVVRSAKDMRARLAPDLSPLHKIILGWDYYHNGDFPPNSRPDVYSAVPNTFRTANDYQSTFGPLLTLEAWQGFVKSREENGNIKPYDIKVVSQASVDAFREISSTMTHTENRELSISEGDVVLLSKSKSPSAQEPHCLARVFRVKRKQAHIEVSYRVMPSNPLQSALVIGGMVYGSKLQSITPLEREYGALLGLQYYDLCDEIIRAKPSPLLSYKNSQLEPLISNYNVNTAQSKAVKSAIDNDAFTLIQGPPGSGKTKTIVAVVGAILSERFRHRGTAINVPGQAHSDAAQKKLLVCAPSNAAVDELVLRFKKGIKVLNGEEHKVNIVRLGRGNAINAHVQDVTLEVLVNKKMGVSNANGNDSEATRKIFQQHKEVSDQLRQVRDQLDSGTAQGPDASKLQDDMNSLRRQKAMLGTKIDTAKDNEKLASRNADLKRRQAQQQVLSDAHIICATLSGSGHDMFQGLSIEFDTVIVDEAAQCVEMSALIPLKYGCSKCILVGDPKQLPPTVFSKEAARFQYEQSLFVRMQKNHPKDVHLLDTQYRMHPEISLFPSQTFYDGKLLDGGDMAGLRKQPWHSSLLLGPYRFFDVEGQHSAAPKGHSLINIAEINIAMQLYKRLTSDFPKYDFRGKVGIITPYKSQLRELQNRFIQQYGPTILEEVEFNTTDAFQGRESEIIIFSCVRASPAGGIGFLQDIRRMNVGLTRAKSSLWVLGNSQSLVRGQFWRKLVENAQQRDRYTGGNLQVMLSKHSSAYPAPKDCRASNVPSRPLQVKQEPQSHFMSRSSSDQSSNSSGQDSKKQVKHELKHEYTQESKYGIKQEQTDESSLVSNGKRKFSLIGDEDMKADDVEMQDADPEPASSTINDGGRSAPADFAATARKDSTSVSDASKPTPEAHAALRPGDIVGAMAMRPPKIRRRPREPVDPFIRRQPTKKPKAG